jgi:hypothetical protein
MRDAKKDHLRARMRGPSKVLSAGGRAKLLASIIFFPENDGFR